MKITTPERSQAPAKVDGRPAGEDMAQMAASVAMDAPGPVGAEPVSAEDLSAFAPSIRGDIPVEMDLDAKPALTVGSRVKVTRNEGSWLHDAIWWPEDDITGTVTKLCKNGSMYVAQDQFRNQSEDGRRTRVFSAADNVNIESA